MSVLPGQHRQWLRIGSAASILAAAAYAFGFWIDAGRPTVLLSALAFPPLLLLGCLSITEVLGRGNRTPALKIALLFAGERKQ